jgi:hypothetical protein
MDWTRAIDGYCERLGPGLLAEPVNLVTNAAFLIAAAWMWRRTGPGRTGVQALLCLLLAGIGIGSGLFHSFAQSWSALLDVAFIAFYVLVYVYAANRDYWGLPVWAAGLGTAAALPYIAALAPVFAAVPFLAVSAVYWPIPLLIATYAIALRGRAPATARGLALGAGLLCVSLIARSVDETLCAAVPLGTHWVWHVLNGAMLGWMVEVHRRHLERARALR